MVTAPILTTDRLLLRGHKASDFKDVHELWSDPAVVEYITGKPAIESESWARLLRYVGHWNVAGYGYWVVEDRENGQFFGEVGFADHRRDVQPSFGGKPEAGWVMALHAQGRGLATEAVQAALGWADQNLEAERTVCMIVPKHIASCRLASRVGFKASGKANFCGDTVAIYERAAAR